MNTIDQIRYTSAQNFSVDLTLAGSKEPVDAIFLECRGFNCTQDVIEICEVTPQLWGKANKSRGRVVRTKLPGNVKYANLLLLRGSSNSYTFWNWFQSVQDGNWSKLRLDASVVIYDPCRERLAKFDLSRAWPASYKISDLNSRSEEFLIENLEVAFESIQRVEP